MLRQSEGTPIGNDTDHGHEVVRGTDQEPIPGAVAAVEVVRVMLDQGNFLPVFYVCNMPWL